MESLPHKPEILPVLYTFRRCPYAIRARLAIQISGVKVNKYEVTLRNKPEAMLSCSSKGTVPVLQLPDGRVIDESLDIMCWALHINDPGEWLDAKHDLSVDALSLIEQNDGRFKYALDRYKYASRFAVCSPNLYRKQAQEFLHLLELRLTTHRYLIGDHCSIADIAILPFIRQFSQVDRQWFEAAPYPYLVQWLDRLVESALFVIVMQKS